jgi:hypothetical protein
MFENFYRYIKTEHGNAMVLVVFITLCCTIIMGTVMYVTFTQVEYSQAYKKSSNIDVLAMSGAEKGLSILNDSINKNMETWVKNVSDNILSDDPTTPNILGLATYQNINENVSYDGDLKYSGNYHLKEASRVKLFANELKKTITTNIASTLSSSTYTYYVTVEGIKYRIDGSINLGTGQVSSIASRLDSSGNIEVSSKVNATFSLKNNTYNDEILYEQYGWKPVLSGETIVPEKFRNAILSWGDLVIKGVGSKVTVTGVKDSPSNTILGNVTVKGYKPIDNEQNQGDDFGGIYVMDGGSLVLTDEASAYTQSNIHTKRTFGGNTNASKISIDGSAVAESISIEDNFYFNNDDRDVSSFVSVINYSPYNEATMTKNNFIAVNKDAYTYNDINISRYVNDSTIKIGNNAFGVKSDAVNPNNASAIYNQGLGSSLIDIGHAAFVHGKIFVSYKSEFKRLEESIGVPYDDIYEKIEEYSPKPEGFDYHYINYFKSLISNGGIVKNDRVKVSTFTPETADFLGYSQGYASANGKYYKSVAAGGTTIPNTTSPTMWSVVADTNTAMLFFKETGSESFSSNTPFKDNEVATKNEIKAISKMSNLPSPEGTYNWTDADVNTIWEQGIKGYMDKKLKIFNDDFIDRSVALDRHTADQYNPIEIITDEVGVKEIDIKNFCNDSGQCVPTIIIDTRRDGTIKLTNSGASEIIFNGYLYTNGKVMFDNNHKRTTINGAIVAGNHEIGSTNTNIAKLEKGDYAGVLVTSGAEVKINYDISQLLRVRTDDFSLRRKVYDYLKLTDYNSTSLKVNNVAGILDKLKIATNSAISVDVNDAYKIKYKINKLKYVNE